MVYPIVKYGDAMLEKEAKNVTEFDTPELHKLIEDMFESMYGAKGVAADRYFKENRGDRLFQWRACQRKDRSHQSHSDPRRR